MQILTLFVYFCLAIELNTQNVKSQKNGMYFSGFNDSNVCA